MIHLEKGVRLTGLKPEALLGIVITDAVFEMESEMTVLTSIVDGEHDGGQFSTSSHYAGLAFDVLKPDNAADGFVDRLQHALGEEFHVLAHKTLPHIHVAFIPKRP